MLIGEARIDRYAAARGITQQERGEGIARGRVPHLRITLCEAFAERERSKGGSRIIVIVAQETYFAAKLQRVAADGFVQRFRERRCVAESELAAGIADARVVGETQAWEKLARDLFGQRRREAELREVKPIAVLLDGEFVPDEVDLEVGHQRRRQARSQVHTAAEVLAIVQEEWRSRFLVAGQAAHFVPVVAQPAA